MPAIVNSETTGTVKEWPSNSLPSGYMFCNGAVLSQATYSSLFAVIGVSFNTGGEGVGNYRLPDLRGKACIGHGQDTTHGLSNRVLAQYLGVENIILSQSETPGHTHSASSMAAEPQAHNHSASSSTTSIDHTHTYTRNDPAGNVDGPSNDSRWGAYAGANFAGPNSSLTHGHTASTDPSSGTHSHTLTTNNGDGTAGTSHPNMQPYLVLNYIIKF